MALRIPNITYPGDNAANHFPVVVLIVDQDGNPVAAGSGGGSTGGTVSDPPVEAALGTPADTPWSGTGAGTAIALLKSIYNRFLTAIAVTQNGVWTVGLSAGTNVIGALSASGPETPFVPLPNATTGLTVGPTATTAPIALATVTASTYRVRNAASSASPAAWRLATTNTGQAAVMPVAASTAGTGGTVGDKTIDPGGVEVFALTAAQQTAIAAGTLYLSAITPAGGSATIYVTPGVAGR